MKVDEIKIRKACIEDAAEIANIHINSWREAYKGLLPQDFLDDRPLYFKNRYELWKKCTSRDEDIIYIAEHPEHGIIGFSNAGPGRDSDKSDYGEVYCIYLLQKFHKIGLGFKLLKACFDELLKRNYSQSYLWVLDKNPTIKFYEKTRAVEIDSPKEIEIADEKVIERCYGCLLYTSPSPRDV